MIREEHKILEDGCLSPCGLSGERAIPVDGHAVPLLSPSKDLLLGHGHGEVAQDR